MTARRSTGTARRRRSRCGRCGHQSRKPSRLPVVALALLAVIVFDVAVVVGLLHGALYGAGLLFVWYALCLGAVGTYERGR